MCIYTSQNLQRVTLPKLVEDVIEDKPPYVTRNHVILDHNPLLSSSVVLSNDTDTVSPTPEIEVETFYVDVIDPDLFSGVANIEKFEEVVTNDEGKKNEFKCPSKRCTRILKTEKAFERHLETHNKPAIFPCDICGKLLKSKKLVRKHKNCVHNKPVFPCPHCEVTKTTAKRLDQHMNKEHKPRFCHKCRKDFVTGRAFMVHNKNCGKRDRIGNRRISQLNQL